MRFGLDTSVLVSFFVEEDEHHEEAVNLFDSIMEGEIEYVCLSPINIIETGYVLERITKNREFSQNCMYSLMNEMGLDIMGVSWDFMVKLAELKSKNPISFCDNATLAAAELNSCKALFTKEKEIILKKTKLSGPKIVFLEDLEIVSEEEEKPGFSD